MKCFNSIVKITVFSLLILSAMILPKNSSSQQATLRIVKWNGTVASSTNSMLFETANPIISPSNARLGFPYYSSFVPNSLLDLRATSNTPSAFSATSRTINGKTTSVELVNDLVPMIVTGSDSLLFKFIPASSKNVVFDNDGVNSSFKFYGTTQMENPAKGGNIVTLKIPLAEIRHDGTILTQKIGCNVLNSGAIATGSLTSGTIATGSLTLTNGAQNGYILVSNSKGDANWRDPSAIFPSASLWQKNEDNSIYTLAPGVAIGNYAVKEKFQVGQSLTFYDGTSRKAISYNYSPTNGSTIINGAASSMVFENNGGIVFEHSASGLNLQGGLYLLNNGTVGIKTNKTDTYTLAVNGVIGCKEIKVEVTSSVWNWPDYVFSPDYHLPALSEVERFVTTNGHLPDVPSAKEVANEGIAVGEMQATLLKKVEELTLYIIHQEKTIEKQQSQINELKTMIQCR